MPVFAIIYCEKILDQRNQERNFLRTSLPVTRDGAHIKTTKPNDRKVIFPKLKKTFTFNELNKGKQAGLNLINLNCNVQIKTTKSNNRKIIFSKLEKRFTDNELTEGKQVEWT